jgi:hypothetical protein
VARVDHARFPPTEGQKGRRHLIMAGDSVARSPWLRFGIAPWAREYKKEIEWRAILINSNLLNKYFLYDY